MWLRLERAMLLQFRAMFGAVPRCNSQGKGIAEHKDFTLFARKRAKEIILALSE
jgi:hypothetical protein